MKKIIALMPVLSLLIIGCVTFSPYGRGGGIFIPVQKPRSVRTAPVKLGATVFGALGALVGGSIGAIAGTDETILIDGMSNSEIKSILEKLRKNARVSSFQ